mmetsp:Transcript_142972/g.249489  ORF Transcript_142972/g.249489 Transcript_142972/m.249489 type:complete len:130 (-) Transcript_142972:235-624(-)
MHDAPRSLSCPMTNPAVMPCVPSADVDLLGFRTPTPARLFGPLWQSYSTQHCPHGPPHPRLVPSILTRTDHPMQLHHSPIQGYGDCEQDAGLKGYQYCMGTNIWKGAPSCTQQLEDPWVSRCATISNVE